MTDDLFSYVAPKPKPNFDGATYDARRDQSRLAAQSKRVMELMQDGEWRTLDAIAEATGDPPTSISARLRDFRKVKFGGHAVERQYVSAGLHQYRLIVRGA